MYIYIYICNYICVYIWKGAFYVKTLRGKVAKVQGGPCILSNKLLE